MIVAYPHYMQNQTSVSLITILTVQTTSVHANVMYNLFDIQYLKMK